MVIVNQIQKLAKKYQDTVVSLRREFHRHPELSFQEVETTKRIAAELDKLGIPYEINPEKNTGLVACLKGGKPGKAVALRADIDGLPVKELTGLPFASENEGKMHACGHDNHIAMLLGAAYILHEVQDQICGTVYFVFQPAEELCAGAEYMLRFGNWYDKIGSMYAAHVWFDMPAGKVNIQAGPRFAAGTHFYIDVHGTGCHGSLPHQGIDASVVAAAILLNIQTIVSRRVSPLDSVALTIGTVRSGTAFNIVSGEAHMEGTCRYFLPETGKLLETMLSDMVHDTAHQYGATADFHMDLIAPPTINDAACAGLGAKAAAKVVGEDNVVPMEHTMACEDFAFYTEKKPCCYGIVGIRNPEKNAMYPQHSNRYTVDEDVLGNGAAIFAQYALDWLEANK